MIQREFVRTYSVSKNTSTYTVPHFGKWSSRLFCMDVLILIQQTNQELEVSFTDTNTVWPVPDGGGSPGREENTLIFFHASLSSLSLSLSSYVMYITRIYVYIEKMCISSLSISFISLLLHVHLLFSLCPFSYPLFTFPLA